MDLSLSLHSAGDHGSVPLWFFLAAGLVIGGLVGVVVYLWRTKPSDSEEVNCKVNLEFSKRPPTKPETRQ